MGPTITSNWKLFGKLKDGKISDIDFDGFISELYDKGAYNVLKSTSQLENYFSISNVDIDHNSIDIENIPSQAEITEHTIGNRNIKHTEAQVNIYENGDVVIQHNNIQWKFTGSNGIPSDKSKQLHQLYGSQFDKNTIPIKYYKYNPEIDALKDSNKYIDTQSEWILEPDINTTLS